MRLASLIVALALSSAIGAARAEDIESDPFPGVHLLERHVAGPNLRIAVAFTSLCDEGIKIGARTAQSVRIDSQTWGQAIGASLAVNGDFYRTETSVPTVYGDAVGLGTRWPIEQTGLSDAASIYGYHLRHGWIAFGPGWVDFMHDGFAKNRYQQLGLVEGYRGAEFSKEIPEGTLALVSGFPGSVIEGQVQAEFPERVDCLDRHPRTAMGLTQDRKTFILAVVDGRSAASVGMRCADLALLMAEMGAYTAINLDGGGSTSMWQAGRGMVNTPSDGAPRKVANHWGVFASGAGAPASCPIADGDPDAGPGDREPDAGPGGGDVDDDDGEPQRAEPDDDRLAAGCRIGGGAGALPLALLAVVLAACRARRR